MGRHGGAVRVPEARCLHVLNGTLFAVGQFYLCLLFADTGALTAFLAWRGWLLFADAGEFPAESTGLRRRLYTLAGVTAAFGALFRLYRFSVPLRIKKIEMGL